MRRLLAALAVAIGLLLALSGPALAVAVGPKAINPTSDPFRTCPVGANTGRNYLDSEVEPYGAVNPTDSANVIAVWQQDRWSNGGSHGLAAGVTNDGGSHWTVGPLPFSTCAGPSALQYERASDPWVSFGPGTPGDPKAGATAYTVSLSFNQSPGKNGNTVGAAVSYDGGSSWDHVQSLHSDSQTGVPVRCRTPTSSSSTIRSP